MLSFLSLAFLAFIIWLIFKVISGLGKGARVQAINEGMSIPPIVLEPNDNPQFARPDAIAALVQQTVGLGATTCGNFDAPAAGSRLCAFCLSSPPAYIAVCDHDTIGPWVDVVLRLDQDRSFTASTVADIGRGAPRPPEDEIVFFAPGTAIGVLVNEVSDRANGESVLPAAPELFKDYFEEMAEKSRQYMQTQNISQEWLNTIAEGTGVELSGDEAEQINLMRESERLVQIECGCFRSLAESGEFSALQWDEIRNELVAVWDDMPGENAAGVFYQNAEIPDELEVDVEALEDGRGRARERIAALNARLPEDQRLALVGRVSTPVEADIYRGRTPVV